MLFHIPKHEEFPEQLLDVKISNHEYSVLHSHEFFELMYVKSGKLLHKLNGEYCEMYPGDFLFIDLGNIHEYKTEDYGGKSVEVLNLIFTPQIIDNSITECSSFSELLKNPYFGLSTAVYSHHIPQKVMHDNNNEILQLLLQIKSEVENPQELSTIVIHHKLIALLLQILQPKYSGQSIKPMTSATKKILQIIAERYNEDNLLVTACEKLNYSLSYLSNTFKKDMGISFKEYLQNYRIDEAKRMLIYTSSRTNEISKKIGYSDTKYFYNLFKKHTGLTPTAYRKISIDSHSLSRAENHSQ